MTALLLPLVASGEGKQRSWTSGSSVGGNDVDASQLLCNVLLFLWSTAHSFHNHISVIDIEYIYYNNMLCLSRQNALKSLFFYGIRMSCSGRGGRGAVLH